MTSKAQNNSYDPAKMTVFIVDDQDPMRKALRKVATAMGFGEVIEFFDGSDVIKQLAKDDTPVDLIISDIFMRKTSGFELLEHLRSRSLGADVPIIMVTGEGGKEDIVKAVNLGADDYILKPFQVADIEKKILSVLTNYHSPTPLIKLLRQGERLLLEGHLKDALKVFEAAQRLDPASARAQHCKAVTMEKMGNMSEAIRILKESIASNNTYLRSHATLADLYLKLGKRKLGIESLKSELELNPKQVLRQIQLAETLLQDGDSIGAYNHFKDALKEDPKNLTALMGSALATKASGDLDKAVYYFKRARRTNPDFIKPLEQLVAMFEQKGDLEKAVPHIVDELHRTPEKSDVRVILAQLYMKLSDPEKALKVLSDGLTRNPTSVSLLKSKAKILLNTNDAASAAQEYQKLVSLEPTSPHFTLLGLAHMQDEEYQKALSALHSAINGAHDKQRLFTVIADVYKRSGNPLQTQIILSMARKIPGAIAAETLDFDLANLKNQVLERRSNRNKTPRAS